MHARRHPAVMLGRRNTDKFWAGGHAKEGTLIENLINSPSISSFSVTPSSERQCLALVTSLPNESVIVVCCLEWNKSSSLSKLSLYSRGRAFKEADFYVKACQYPIIEI